MLISSERGAAQIVSASDETRFYDDIACLAGDWQAHHADATAYVRVPDGRWIEAHAASYARPAEARTSMGSGLVAFAAVGQGRAADGEGGALTFDDVLRVAGATK